MNNVEQSPMAPDLPDPAPVTTSPVPAKAPAAKSESLFRRLCGKMRFGKKRNGHMGEDLRALVAGRDEETPLTQEEKKLLSAALRFFKITADYVSVPRSDIVQIHINDDLDTVLETFRKSGHSRLPVIREDNDDVIGFITVKDILGYVGAGARTPFHVQDILRPCTFVPDTLNISKVLEEMRKAKVQMVVVVDEYGGTAGLITFKDILEYLVGEIVDEHENASPLMIQPQAPGRYLVDPRMPIEELEERFHTVFTPLDEADGEARYYETVGGLILSMARRMPAPGEKFPTRNGYVFKVLESDPRRLHKIELELPIKPRAQKTK